MYSAEVLDHFANPRHAGDVAEPTVMVEVQNPACGDVLRLSLKVEDGKIVQVGFRAKGCVPAMACASRLAEMLHGRTIVEARQLRREEIVAGLGQLPEASTHAGYLATDALAAAMKQLLVVGN